MNVFYDLLPHGSHFEIWVLLVPKGRVLSMQMNEMFNNTSPDDGIYAVIYFKGHVDEHSEWRVKKKITTNARAVFRRQSRAFKVEAVVQQ